MLKTADLQKRSLSSLYELMAVKIDELRVVGNPLPDHEEFSVLRADILLIQSIINTKTLEKHPGL